MGTVTRAEAETRTGTETGGERERRLDRRREREREGEGRGGGGELWFPSHKKNNRVEDGIFPFHSQLHLYRQEVMPAGSQLLRVQNPAPVRRCGTEGRTSTRDGDRNKNEEGNRHEDRAEGNNKGANGDENRKRGGRERKPWNLQNCIKGELEDTRGGRRQRVASSHRRKTRCPIETVASCGGPESRDGS